jgi:hypothetical protein
MSTFAKGFKDFSSDDISYVRDTLHEAIPITGSIISGTYDNGAGTEYNIKNNSRDLFQSVYDYPYLSSSANQIFDITIGYSTNLSGTFKEAEGNARKLNIYNQMAQVCMGFDETGSVRRFDRDGDLTTGTKIDEAFFINFARILTKDEIKKQSFSLQLLTGGVCNLADSAGGPQKVLTIQDHGARTNYRTNAAVGEYGILYTGSAAAAGSGVGLVFYQAGIAVVSSSVFSVNGDAASEESAIPSKRDYLGPNIPEATNNFTVRGLFLSSSITGAATALRNRIYNISFNNSIDINSTIYFCRANHNEFNYSSNPTYLSSSKIVVKDLPYELPRSFITTVGLYSADNELLAVAKLSEPVQKSPKNTLQFQVRLDY